MQIIRNRKIYDVCVVGSGAGGGMAAKVLTEAGADVVMLDDLKPYYGVAFFNRFRDLTASGLWSSKMGIEDLHNMGNRFVAQWNGCPEDALKKLGVGYPNA